MIILNLVISEYVLSVYYIWSNIKKMLSLNTTETLTLSSPSCSSMKKEKIDEKPQIILPLITEVLQKQIIEIDNQKATSCIHTPPTNQQQWL